jgi:hypothetical protein
MRVAIAIHDWKIVIFDRRLTKAGFTYEKHLGITSDTLSLIVVTDEVEKLKKVILESNTEAYNTGKK